MKKLYVLCLVTLAVVILDIVLFHSRSASAQNAPSPYYLLKGIRVDRVVLTGTTGTIPDAGDFRGFQCVVDPQGGGPQCFVASETHRR